jgi:predicted nucleic acid binding AN1-type Zn finger protein
VGGHIGHLGCCGEVLNRGHACSKGTWLAETNGHPNYAKRRLEHSEEALTDIE